MSSILALITLEAKMEMRRKYALGGAVLYVVSTVFILYASLYTFDKLPWDALFWIVSLFIAINAIAKSFSSQQDGSHLYLYQLASPLEVIAAKTIYNVLLIFFLLLLSMIAFLLFVGLPVLSFPMFILTIFMGSLGMGIVLTFISAISNKTDNSAVFTAILGFPVLIPILLSLIKLTKASFVENPAIIYNDIVILLAIDFILLGVILLLFPFLWKD